MAWMGLQQVLESLQNPGIEDYPYDTEEPIVVIEPQDSQNIYEYANDIPAQYFDQMLPYAGKEQQEQQDQANLYNLINQPDREEYIVPDTFGNLYNTNAQLYEPFDDAYVPEYRELSENDANDNLEDEEDIDWRAMNAEDDTRPKNKRQVIQDIPQSFMQDIYSTEEDEDDDDESDSEDAKDISNYDFDYEDSSAAKDEDDDDILYYNGESGEPMFYNKKNEPVPVESVFDRRERLDVKKPGPFFAHSPNNFFLDKLLPENFDENSDEDNAEEGGEDETGGQTEYELPLSQQTRPKKSSDTVFTIKEPRGEDNTLTINYNRLSLEAQVEELINTVAEHLGLQPSVFSLARQPKSSQLELKVHANPRNLNASTMAAILNADSTLADHADNTLGISINGFEAGSKEDIVTRVSTGHDRSRLLLLVLLGSLTVAVVGAALGPFLMLRRH